jgi:DNA-binding response OmpR family regulator
MAAQRYDCVILDLGLPDMLGESLLKIVRSIDSAVFVVVTTAREAVEDRVQLLDIGADDYMIKPVNLDELCARLRAISRRGPLPQGEAGDTGYGPLRLYPARHEATWHGVPVALTRKEYWILETLVRRKQQILTRAHLEQTLYGWGEEVTSNAIEVHIHFLRRKLNPGLILTVHGIGYRLAPEASLK